MKNSLTLDQDDPAFYAFEVIARDQGAPTSRKASGSVHISIDRGLQRGIGFDSSFHLWEVIENTPIARGNFLKQEFLY